MTMPKVVTITDSGSPYRAGPAHRIIVPIGPTRTGRWIRIGSTFVAMLTSTLCAPSWWWFPAWIMVALYTVDYVVAWRTARLWQMMAYQYGDPPEPPRSTLASRVGVERTIEIVQQEMMIEDCGCAAPARKATPVIEGLIEAVSQLKAQVHDLKAEQRNMHVRVNTQRQTLSEVVDRQMEGTTLSERLILEERAERGR